MFSRYATVGDIPNCSLFMYDGEGGVTFREELRSLELLLANIFRGSRKLIEITKQRVSSWS